MKIVTWNCQGAYRKKAAPIAQYRPDLAVIQECEPLDKLRFDDSVPPPSSQLWFGDGAHKGVGVFSYTDLKFEVHDNYDTSIRFCIPIKVSGHLNFHLIAIWAMNHQNRQLSYIGQVHLAVEKYRDFIRRQDTILTGDFNSNKQWDTTPRVGNHSSVVDALVTADIFSVYHEYFGEQHGEESQDTFFLYRKQDKAYHLDYCFAPRTWIERVSAVSVGTYAEWSKVSDHSPVFAEFSD